MSMRTFSTAALFLALSACADEPSSKTATADAVQSTAPEKPGATSLAAAEASAAKAALDDGRVSCAVAGATEFSRSCQIETTESGTGLILTIRHPDGGFRRLQVVKDGRGVVAADGAEFAEVTPLNPREIEVLIAGNRYRIPATVKAPAAAPPAAPAKTAAR